MNINLVSRARQSKILTKKMESSVSLAPKTLMTLRRSSTSLVIMFQLAQDIRRYYICLNCLRIAGCHSKSCMMYFKLVKKYPVYGENDTSMPCPYYKIVLLGITIVSLALLGIDIVVYNTY